MNKFPCRKCILRICCTTFCDKLLGKKRDIGNYFIFDRRCPDCGYGAEFKLVKRAKTHYSIVELTTTDFYCSHCKHYFVEHGSYHVRYFQSEIHRDLLIKTGIIKENQIE